MVREFFLEGGFAMYPIALLGLVAVGLGLGAIAGRSRPLAFGAIACATVVMLLGVGGMMWGRSRTDEALAMVDPAMAAEIRVQGYKESNRPIQLAGPFALLALVLGAAGLGLSKDSRQG